VTVDFPDIEIITSTPLRRRNSFGRKAGLTKHKFKILRLVGLETDPLVTRAER
jgi:hypothetical protein